MAYSQRATRQRVSGKAYYLFGLLWLAMLIAFIDKTVLSLMLSSIQAQLRLSDSGLGFLAGAAFGITYLIGALVNGTIADRANRIRLVGVMVAGGSLATVLCGVADSFLLLVLFRAVVGFAEGGLNPTASSLVGDAFPKSMRAAALAVLFSAAGGGIMVTFVAGGPLLHWLQALGNISLTVLQTRAPWQMAFILVGLPGLAVAVLILTSVGESRRSEEHAANNHAHYDWGQLITYVRTQGKLYSGILVGMPIAVLGSYSLLPWMPVLLKRVHNWDVASVGLIYGLTSGPAMILGSLLAGRFVGALRRRGYADATYRFCMISSFWLVGFSIVGLALPRPVLTTTLVAIGFLMYMVPPAMMYAVISEVAPNRMRGRLGALALVSAGLILNSVGPWAVGVLNDYAFKTPNAIGYSILCISVPSVILGGLIMLRGLPQYAAAAAQARSRVEDTNLAAIDHAASRPASTAVK